MMARVAVAIMRSHPLLKVGGDVTGMALSRPTSASSAQAGQNAAPDAGPKMAKA
jgi:hypothetical protein